MEKIRTDVTHQKNAHYNKSNDSYQSLFSHLQNTANISEKKSHKFSLENTAYLAALLHDTGKYSQQWQAYFENAVSGENATAAKKEDHSTAGGQFIEKIAPQSLLSEMVQSAIYSHHGLMDEIGWSDKSSLYINRRKNAESLPIEECENQFYKEFDKDDVEKRYQLAKNELIKLIEKIKSIPQEWDNPNAYGNRNFFLGMYQRMLTSILIDADRRDTEDFMRGIETEDEISHEEMCEIWSRCIENVEEKINGYHDKSGINQYRSEISDTCKEASNSPNKLYRLMVPTGAGKTLSSLRFAVNHAKKFQKQRIIYVAPFNSIVEQNAEEIRNAIGNSQLVLEHHCNIIMENEEDLKRYNRITEDWSSPIVVTTAVQFLNTLFDSKTQNVRRTHSLANSIIIIDEVQALPVKVLELFNLAANFLTEFVDTTLLLVTATQPILDQLPKNRLLPPQNMVAQIDKYQEKFRRTEIQDCTEITPGGFSIDEAAAFVLEKATAFKKVLFIVNTKACARTLFLKLRELCSDTFDIQHLSTNMCPKHRKDVLKQIKDNLQTDKLQICISTQMIEAGVDISFPCVIRSLAGLDNIIQSAGRCNRNKELELGHVYIIRMSKEAENLSQLEDIRRAREGMQPVLQQFKQIPGTLDNRLDSEKAIAMYYHHYFPLCLEEMAFPQTIEWVSTNIVDMLSDNSKLLLGKKGTRQILNQSFKTAGECFEVIEAMNKNSLIVPYEEKCEQLLMELEDETILFSRKKQILGELQQYTVSISETERRKIEHGIDRRWEDNIFMISKRFYNKNIGITTNPEPMDGLIM